MTTNYQTGRVNFSTLKKFALSPLHYKTACLSSFEPTRDMRVGTIVHHLVLGPRPKRPIVCYPGKIRSGNEWKAFAEAHADKEIMTQSEWADAVPIAESVKRDPEARRWLEGRAEVSLNWDDAGLQCTTGGIDVIGDGWIADLKTTSCTEPLSWQRHATKLLYHAQMAFYATGARANGYDVSKGLVLVGVEADPPYAVTCLKLTEATIAHGMKTIALWMERLRVCRDNDYWPAYTQTTVDFDLPEWMTGGGEE